jgi:hypothetical protein
MIGPRQLTPRFALHEMRSWPGARTVEFLGAEPSRGEGKGESVSVDLPPVQARCAAVVLRTVKYSRTTVPYLTLLIQHSENSMA